MSAPVDTAPAPLWTFRKSGSSVTCEVRFVKEGVEVRALQDGGLFHSRIHADGEEAMAWAKMFRLMRLAMGWRELRNRRAAPNVIL